MSFLAQWHHVIDVEIVIPLFGHCVNLASMLSVLPGGLLPTLSMMYEQNGRCANMVHWINRVPIVN